MELRQRGAVAPRVLLVLVLLAIAAGGGYWYFTYTDQARENGREPTAPTAPADLPAQARTFCGACHAYPPADTFPRSAWKEQVERGYRFFERSTLRLTPPPIAQLVRYYEQRAPERLPPSVSERAASPLPVRFARETFAPTLDCSPPAISHVQLVQLQSGGPKEILACEMGWGLVLAFNPREAKPQWRILGKVPNPAHAEVVDLDGDGIRDIIVADLGSFQPADRPCGSVVWLRGKPDGTYTSYTLLDKVGRVADVQAADFNGDGKLDLIVAAFGWQEVGEIILLENRTTDWNHPQFTPHVIDKRHGGIHVPVIDINGDGKPDFVALIAQEHEEICAYINEGNFRFRTEKLYVAPHPAFGSSGIQMVDLDGDGHIDILYTNGDVLDKPYLLKPYHQVQWLRNCGTGKLEFEHRPIAPMYGVHRAVAADFDGDGDLDIVAVSWLPKEGFPQRDQENPDAIILLEQTSPGKFVRHTLASKSCDHVTCFAGDVYGSGRPDIITANFTNDERAPALLILRNLGGANGKK